MCRPSIDPPSVRAGLGLGYGDKKSIDAMTESRLHRRHEI
jgi:hypothetical protein